MAVDDLTRPLGLAPSQSTRRRRVLFGIAGVAVVIALAGGAAWVLLGPGHGRTTAVARIESDALPPSHETTGSTTPAAKPLTDTTASDQATLTDVTPDGGVNDVGNSGVVIRDANAPTPVRLAAAPRLDLVEKSRYGLLPRVGSDGTRPLDAYARPSSADGTKRRVAIVVGGIGIAPETTELALERLPGAVTLAFAPYGDGLPRLLAEARAAGHEALLQIPMEPFDYPKVNPGPRTLTTDASAATNLDRLHWLMSRITTYVGTVNYMGARFTASLDEIAPVRQDIANRGLLYLDDGSSARSRAAEAAPGTPFLRADMILDVDMSTIDERLDQLAAIARERGFAIGVATAFPTSINHIADFAKKAEAKGITLVPLSALVAPGRS